MQRPQPTVAHLRTILYLGVVCFIFAQAGIYAAHRREPSDESNPWLIDPSRVWTGKKQAEHPIKDLMTEAEETFRAKLKRQSKTLKAAATEYQSRHGRPPPKGFENWWTFAQMNNVTLVDEYDSLVRDLEPFWQFSGYQFRARIQEAARYPDIDIVRIRTGQNTTAVRLEDGVETSHISGRAAAFLVMIKGFEKYLPDMDIALNGKVESRVVVPWGSHASVYSADDDGSETKYIPDWRGQGNLWDSFRLSCSPSSPARLRYSSLRPSFVGQRNQRLVELLGPAESEETTFMSTVATHFDFCRHPWAHYRHGHFFSDWRVIPALLPVLSPARAPGFMDIKLPSHYYYWPARKLTYGFDTVNLVVKEKDGMEIPWDMKGEKMFWRGPTTGGGSSPPGYAAQYHRHRLVRSASPNADSPNKTIVFAEPADSKNFISAQVPAAVLNNDVMDVAFVKAVYEGNYPGGEPGLKKDHRFTDDGVPLGEHWAHKYLLDLDGMGYSGKFMALMQSDSAVIKSTVFEEFYVDSIQPWLHFIPLSPSFSELYNIHAFFSGPTEAALIAANATVPRKNNGDGDLRLRRIARAGKQWKRTMARKVDMEAYVFRLCLELARLAADDRESMDFEYAARAQ